VRAGPATRVAAAATIIIAVVYIVSVTALNLLVSTRLTAERDEHLASRLEQARHHPEMLTNRPSAQEDPDAVLPGLGDDDSDVAAAPVFFWALNAHGAVIGHSQGAPDLPPSVLSWHLRNGLAVTASLRSGSAVGSFRLKMARVGSNWLIAGQSRADDLHAQHLLVYTEVLAGPVVLLAMFLGSLVVGLRALAPVEQARRRQLEFTADASHELRTPLSVIGAEADLALSSERPAEGYRDALVRIQGESKRLKHLVADMLWLARFDSSPPAPRNEPVDLATLAEASADRFRAVGRTASVTITAETTSPAPALISAPPEWIDRLAGVLMDNACRYAGAGGQVRISVRCSGSRVSLTVEDSGPGIPEASRARLFDRFHRATEQGPGAGLGLAIGDSIVRSTGGRWRIGDSPLGGALIEASWRQFQPHRLTASRLTGNTARTSE
jgi:two-component system, OmpR family, sensor histidine kinase CiaH